MSGLPPPISQTGGPETPGHLSSSAPPFHHHRLMNGGKDAKLQRTSNRWLLTFFPFLFQTILGCGSPEAWHTKDATPPWTPFWSSGVLVNLGGAEQRETKHRWSSGVAWKHSGHRLDGQLLMSATTDINTSLLKREPHWGAAM